MEARAPHQIWSEPPRGRVVAGFSGLGGHLHWVAVWRWFRVVWTRIGRGLEGDALHRFRPFPGYRARDDDKLGGGPRSTGKPAAKLVAGALGTNAAGRTIDYRHTPPSPWPQPSRIIEGDVAPHTIPTIAEL